MLYAVLEPNSTARLVHHFPGRCVITNVQQFEFAQETEQ